MKKPPQNGMAISESLYGSGQDVTTDSKIANPTELNNLLYPRPELIPGIEYPISEREEELLDKAWQHFCNLKSRGVL